MRRGSFKLHIGNAHGGQGGGSAVYLSSARRLLKMAGLGDDEIRDELGID